MWLKYNQIDILLLINYIFSEHHLIIEILNKCIEQEFS